MGRKNRRDRKQWGRKRTAKLNDSRRRFNDGKFARADEWINVLDSRWRRLLVSKDVKQTAETNATRFNYLPHHAMVQLVTAFVDHCHELGVHAGRPRLKDAIHAADERLYRWLGKRPK